MTLQDVNILSDNLKFFMKKLNVKESALARMTGIPQPTLHKILSRKTIDPRFSTLSILAEYFSVDVTALFSEDTVPMSENDLKLSKVPFLSWEYDPLTGKLRKLKDKEPFIIYKNKELPGQFALLSKPSFASKFKTDTILIVDCKIQARDGDYVLVAYLGSREATLRKLYIDGPDVFLKSLHSENDNVTEYSTLEYKIIGVLVEERYSYIQTKKEVNL